MKTVCPKCKEPQYCWCDHCAPTFSKDQVVQIAGDNDIVSCGHCGHSMHIDYWQDEEVRQLEAAGLWPTGD